MANGRKQSVLIVDADKATRDAVKACIEGSEFTYWEAQGRGESVEFAKRVQDIAIDYLVVDALLPPFNGVNLAKKVLEYRPGIKVLFLCGVSREEGFEDELPSSPSDFILKPFGKAELLDKLRGLDGSGEESFSSGMAMEMGS